jgi:hypothetical protein
MNGVNRNIYPADPQAMVAFNARLNEPGDSPLVEMNDQSARDIGIIWKSIASLAEKWRGHGDLCFPGQPTSRDALWGDFASGPTEVLPVVAEFLNRSTGQGKVAIDLGCGNAPAMGILLAKGWRVIAVDSSRSALNILVKQNPSAIATGQLVVVEDDMATFIPDQPADLVIAADSLAYTDPAKFQALWHKIHDIYVKEGGFLVGSLFKSTNQQVQLPVMNGMKELGAWFLHDRRMVRPLLTHAGYEVEKCIFRIEDRSKDPLCIQFIAKNVSGNGDSSRKLTA